MIVVIFSIIGLLLLSSNKKEDMPVRTLLCLNLVFIALADFLFRSPLLIEHSDPWYFLVLGIKDTILLALCARTLTKYSFFAMALLLVSEFIYFGSFVEYSLGSYFFYDRHMAASAVIELLCVLMLLWRSNVANYIGMAVRKRGVFAGSFVNFVSNSLFHK